MDAQAFASRIANLDISLFQIDSQTTRDDRRSFLAVHNAMRSAKDGYVYLECGSHIGGSLLPHILDPRCRLAYSVDKRPAALPDERGVLFYPDNQTKRMVDNTCGTGQSAIDGILRATNTLLAGKTVVVAGFGASGRGVAEYARGFGAQVIVTEIDPVRALDASLRGFRVLPMAQAAPLGEVFVTVTGSVDVIGAEHLAVMRDGAILANAGHFDAEIDVRALADLAVAISPGVRPHVDAYDLGDGRTLLLLAEGRVVNLVAAEGHPPEVMDLAFGLEALALAWLAGNTDKLPAGVHEVPAGIDAEAASLMLATTGTSIDTLTPAQLAYRESWRIGS